MSAICTEDTLNIYKMKLISFGLEMEPLLSYYSPNSTDVSENGSYYQEVINNGTKFRYCTFPGCGKVFRYKSESVRHMLSHTAEKPYECPFTTCRKAFSRLDALRNHVRVHTGETPYKCEEPGCGRSFSNKSGLRYHSLQHKGEKEYKCPFPTCEKTFLTISQLRSHEKAFSCHKKLSAQVSPIQEDEEYSLGKYKIRRCENTFKEYIVPEMESVKDFGCENKIQNNIRQEEKVSDDLQEEFLRMVKAIVQENNMLKKMLNTIDKLKGQTRENKSSENKLNVISEMRPQMQSISQELSDEHIFSFLKLDNQERFY